MTAKTDRYGLAYPEPTDLVSSLPEVLKAQADTTERALADVDDRHTQDAYVPVVRPTADQLDQVTPNAGQLAVTTSDNQPHIGIARTWEPLQIARTYTTRWKAPYSSTPLLLSRSGRLVIIFGRITLAANFNVTYQRAYQTIPTGYRPAQNGSIIFHGNNNQGIDIVTSHDGSVYITGKAATGYYFVALGAWFTDDDWPVA